MEFKLSYNAPEGLNFKSISVIGDFNDWVGDSHNLINDGNGIWSISLDLSPGTYKYRFLVNNEFTLNDPTANIYLPNEHGILMSVIIINDNSQRMYNQNKYNVDIHDYILTTDISEFPCESNTHLFFVPQDEKIVCRLDFSSVTGIHTVSILWYTPDMELFDINESILWQPDGIALPIMLWFWIDSSKNTLKNGTWRIKFLLDGSFIFEDTFVIDVTDDLIIEMIKSRDSFFGLTDSSIPNDNSAIVANQDKDLDIIDTIDNLAQISLKPKNNEQTGSSNNIIEEFDDILDNIIENLYEHICINDIGVLHSSITDPPDLENIPNIELPLESVENKENTAISANDCSVSSEPDLAIDTTIDLIESISEINYENDNIDIKKDKSENNSNRNQLPDL